MNLSTLPKPDYVSADESVVLYCADSREVLAALPDGSIDMIWTDPPYGHNNNNGDLIANREKALGRGEPGKARPIANDGFADANNVFLAMVEESPRLLASGGCCCCCCCCGGGPDPQFARWALWMDGPLDFKQMVVWDKGPMGMGWHYRRSYETVLVAQKRGGPCRWFDDSKRIENIIRPGDHGVRKIIPRATDHPTPKPVELAAHFVRLHSDVEHVVLDPFMGRGPSGVACVQMQRQYIGIEIDREHFDIAVKRIEQAFADQALFQQQAEECAA